MGSMTVEQVAEAMYALVKECHGKRNLRATDLTKAMIDKIGAESCDKQMCKEAIRLLVDGGRCTYAYLGGSYIVLPPETC